MRRAVAPADGPIPSRIRVETLGPELLALDPDRGLVHRIAAIDVRELRAGRWESYVDSMAPEVLDAVLAALGRPRWDRRRVLTSSGALASAGIVTMMLPSSAMAVSINGIPAGTGFDEGSVSFVPTDGNAAVSYSASYLTWTVPTGVTRVQMVAFGTDGTRAGTSASPAPYTGTPGRGAFAIGTFDVTAGSDLVIAFSGAADWSPSRFGGGAGGQAAGVGDLSGGTSGAWLIVAGGGGGAGNAGHNVTTGYAASGDHQGGDGGDAGTGGTAGSGTAGSGANASGTTLGGGGATLIAAGAGSAGANTSTNGGDGGSPSGPTNSSSTTSLGEGGLHYNNTSSGGAGGGGLYGGGAAGSGSNSYALGGGGGGSSYVNVAKRSAGTESRFQTFSRADTAFAKVDLYW